MCSRRRRRRRCPIYFIFRPRPSLLHLGRARRKRPSEDEFRGSSDGDCGGNDSCYHKWPAINSFGLRAIGIYWGHWIAGVFLPKPTLLRYPPGAWRGLHDCQHCALEIQVLTNLVTPYAPLVSRTRSRGGVGRAILRGASRPVHTCVWAGVGSHITPGNDMRFGPPSEGLGYSPRISGGPLCKWVPSSQRGTGEGKGR